MFRFFLFILILAMAFASTCLLAKWFFNTDLLKVFARLLKFKKEHDNDNYKYIDELCEPKDTQKGKQEQE